MDRVRLDKWLWAARCFKTRTQATTACDGGHVTIDGKTAKPSRSLRPGDIVEVTTVTSTGSRTRTLEVVSLADKRGSATVARGLYTDRTAPIPEIERLAPPPGRSAGRPSKKDRRALRKMKRRD